MAVRKNTNKVIASIDISDYPDRVIISKSRRPVLYVSANSNMKGEKNIPPSYLNNNKFFFNEGGVLINKKTGEPQLANPQTAGKPRYWVVNFQDIWNQNIAKQSRAMRIDRLKDVIRPHIKTIPKVREYPVEISIVLFDTKCPVDISNRGAIYTKVIEDLLVKEGVIIDDSVEYVNCSGRIKFVQVSREEDKKMRIQITKSDNNSI